MALTDIEEEVLRQLDEDLSDEYNWTGEVGLREALGDAIDELCIFGNYFEEKVMIPLKGNTNLYEISLNNAFPLYIKSAKLWETDRPLECESLIGMAQKDSQWMISRGSPFKYIPLSSDLVMFYPCNASDGDSVQLRVVCTPEHYGSDREFLTIREETEDALISYGKYYLLLREKSMIREAMKEYGEFLKLAGMTQQLKHHTQGMRSYLYGSQAHNR